MLSLTGWSQGGFIEAIETIIKCYHQIIVLKGMLKNQVIITLFRKVLTVSSNNGHLVYLFKDLLILMRLSGRLLC